MAETSPSRPKSLLEAFSNTAKALKQYGLERIYVQGLSNMASSESSQNEHRVLTQIEFMREFVFLNRPCIILGAIDEWPAMEKWRNDAYLFDLEDKLPPEYQNEKEINSGEEEDQGEEEEEDEVESDDENEDVEKGPLGPKKITVAITPNGRADAMTYVVYRPEQVPLEKQAKVFEGEKAQKESVPLLEPHPLLEDHEKVKEDFIKEKIFMYATEIKVTLPELYHLLVRSPHTNPYFHLPMYVDMSAYVNSEHPAIAYAQLQNNCLETEYKHLHQDILSNVKEFGNVVFGEEKPEASNVWFGIPASVSSFHQDWVENLYCVVRGVKEFILIPPWEALLLPKPVVPAAKFAVNKEKSRYFSEGRGEKMLDNLNINDFDYLSFEFEPYPVKDGTTVPWIDFDITCDMVERDADLPEGASGEVQAELQNRLRDNERHKSTSLQKLDAEIAEEQSLKRLHPLVARVGPGETLYLPAMWAHRVGQRADEFDIRERAKAKKKRTSGDGETKETVRGENPPLPLIAAVNYWYDMSFDNPAVVLLNEFGLLL